MRHTVNAALAALFLMSCSYVKPMSKKAAKTLRASDTLYVLPVAVEFETRGFFLDTPDPAESRRLSEEASAILEQELQQAFPRSVVKRVEVADAEAVAASPAGVLVRCEIRAFRRTLPRQIVSEALNVLFMVPTMMTYVAFPIEPTCKVHVEFRKAGAAKPIRLKHRDDVQPANLEDLRFQIRAILNPDKRA